MTDTFSQFYNQMQESDNYLKMKELKDGYGYKIWARNAFVGVWIESRKGFLISRYKVGPTPRLFVENHWDAWTPDDPTGTVKPLEIIERFPFELRSEYTDYSEHEKASILKYLDKLEEENPVVEGFNSLQDRKESAIQFGKRLRERKHRILLIGDSVFDNVPYVEEGKDTVTTLRKEMATSATVDSVAVDGYTTVEVLFQLIEGVLKDRPKYDYIFVSIGGNDLLTNQDVYLDSSVDHQEKDDFLAKLVKRFLAIHLALKEMSDNIYWLAIYTPYFDPGLFDENYISTAKQAVNEVNRKLKMTVGPKHIISTSSIVNQPEDFTEVIEPSAVGSGKLAKEISKIVFTSLEPSQKTF